MNKPDHSFWQRPPVRRFCSDRPAVAGCCGIVFLLLVALAAPLLSNGRPLLMHTADGWRMPFWRTLFAPDSPEYLIEQTFNYFLLLIPAWLLLHPVPCRRIRTGLRGLAAILLLLPFFLVSPRMDKTDYRQLPHDFAIFAPIPYGPFEPVGPICAPPDHRHWLGTDDIGRDAASRLIYGTRVSLAVGLGATAMALLIGTVAGVATGFFRGIFDLTVMRLVEIVMCFPTFLLLLILMAILKDRKCDQSILVVIAVIGLTGWIGTAFLVRGETLKQRVMPYIQSCEVAGISAWRTMFVHLLPNITAPILISFTFGVAGAILAESGLSFLGFGVQPPTASWGGLLRQAFDDPLTYWHLTLFPGIALFIAMCSFNFTGEGLRKALTPR
ncbi:MAG: ABC transporter permease [Lentisphaeria bacterium]|nr:ABC transporter permease [Lentisphaeria bacterium]